MNLKSIIAFIMAGSVFGLGVFTSTNNPMAFIDYHAALIVFGGTVAVTAISFQIDKMFLMMKVFYNRVVKGYKIDYVDVNQNQNQNQNNLKNFYNINIKNAENSNRI